MAKVTPSGMSYHRGNALQKQCISSYLDIVLVQRYNEKERKSSLFFTLKVFTAERQTNESQEVLLMLNFEKLKEGPWLSFILDHPGLRCSFASLLWWFARPFPFSHYEGGAFKDVM